MIQAYLLLQDESGIAICVFTRLFQVCLELLDALRLLRELLSVVLFFLDESLYGLRGDGEG